jgi:hypothetical protein
MRYLIVLLFVFQACSKPEVKGCIEKIDTVGVTKDGYYVLTVNDTVILGNIFIADGVFSADITERSSEPYTKRKFYDVNAHVKNGSIVLIEIDEPVSGFDFCVYNDELESWGAYLDKMHYDIRLRYYKSGRFNIIEDGE